LQSAEGLSTHRSSFRPTPDTITAAPFPTPFKTTVFSQGPGRWFEASSRKATPEVQKTPPSTHTAPEARHTKPHPPLMFTRSTANAACGGLKPPPDRRLRRAKPSSPAEHRFLKVLPTYIQTSIPRSWRTSGGPCTTPLRCSPHRSFQGAHTHQRDSA